MKITLYGGVGEVGGNKILIEENTTRIFLDFGVSMGYESNYFSEFLQPRGNICALRDRLEIGALPKINGIYRQDLIQPNGVEHLDTITTQRILDKNHHYLQPTVQSHESYVQKHKESFLKGIFLTHAHLDHVGYIKYLHPSIPLYCTKITQQLIEAVDDVSSSAYSTQAIEAKDNTLTFTKNGSFFPNAPKIEHKITSKRPTINISDQQKILLNDLTVTCLEQDHSVPGSCSFLIENKHGKKLLYTGDIRFHGSLPMTLEDYVNKIGENVDIMLCEGTRIDSTTQLTETQVRENITQEINQTKGLVLIDFSWKDTTRYETIKSASKAAGRTFVINAKLAYLLHRLDIYPAENDNVKVFLKRKASGLYSPNDYIYNKYEFGLSVDLKDDFDDTHYQNGITAEEIKEAPHHYIIMMGYYDFNQLFDLADEKGHIKNSHYIKAQCAPFNDDMELDEERLISWLKKFSIHYDLDETPLPDGCTNPDCTKLRQRIRRSHVSGHASQQELKELITKTRPKTLIPIHTAHPELFSELIKGTDIQLLLPQLGFCYDFS